MDCWKCKKQSDFYCQHQLGVFSCKVHIGEHLLEDSEEGHNHKSIFSKIRADLICSLDDSLNNLEIEKQNVLNEFREAYNLLEANLSQKLSECKKRRLEITNLTKKLKKIKGISELGTREKEKLISLVPENALKDVLKFEEIAKEIQSSFDSSQAPEIAKEIQSSFDSSQVPEILGFNKESQRLLCTNLKDFTIVRTQMPVISDSLISMCKIPDCGVFCYGDWPPSGKTLIITNDKLIMQLPTGRPCCNTKALMYKNSIYVFGGYKNRIEESEFASEFNLLTSNWKVLTSMPKPSTGVYSLPYDEEILLLGCNHDKLYSYNIQKNSYREVTAMVKGKRRVLFGIGKLVYVIESEGNILKSEGNLIEWSIIGSGSAFQPQISYIELYNESFYFMDQTCLLYQFKLSEERLRIVDLIEKEGENASTEFHYLTL